MSSSPNYVKALLKPTSTKGSSRKVWSVDLETVWLPFFTAANVQGDTAIPREALGAPLRLAKEQDGTVKFSKTGRPVLRVAPELASQIKVVRENFVAGLQNYATGVAKNKAEEYKAEVAACQAAGNPINEKANEDIEAALQAQVQAAQEEAAQIMTHEHEREAVPA